MDWNHDGKYDWEDDAQLFAMAKSIEETEETKSTQETWDFTVRTGPKKSSVNGVVIISNNYGMYHVTDS